MDAVVLKSLMDAAGAPAHPIIFLVLGVVTFALHMAAVNLMLGTLGVAAWAALSPNAHKERLSHVLLMTAKVAVGFAVVLGVAPLLFVQVVYDGFWYVSNVLSAWWLVGFIVILIAGYLALYRAYGLNHRYLEDGTPVTIHGAVKGFGWMGFAFVMLLLCGLIMHTLTNQAIRPELWMSWYAPNGVIDPSGRGLHYVLVPRLLFFLFLSLPVTAGWLFAMRRYLINAGEADVGYLDFIEALAHKLALTGGILVALAGIVWMMMLPETMAWLRTSPAILLLIVPMVFFLIMSPVQKKRRLCPPCNYLGFVMPVVMVMLLATLREVLRYGTLLGGFGFDAMDWRINMDWPTTLIFFTTFLVVGGLNISYLVTLAWKSGATEGVYTPSAGINRLGTLCVVSLVAWVVAYFAIGLAVVA